MYKAVLEQNLENRKHLNFADIFQVLHEFFDGYSLYHLGICLFLVSAHI